MIDVDLSGLENRIKRFAIGLATLVRNEAQKTPYEMQALASTHMDFSKPPGVNKESDEIGVRSGAIARGTVPGGVGNITEGFGSASEKAYGSIYGLDPDIIKHSRIQEKGGTINFKTRAYSLQLKARPYLKPAAEDYEQKVLPDKLKRLRSEMIRIWNESAS